MLRTVSRQQFLIYNSYYYYYKLPLYHYHNVFTELERDSVKTNATTPHEFGEVKTTMPTVLLRADMAINHAHI